MLPLRGLAGDPLKDASSKNDWVGSSVSAHRFISMRRLRRHRCPSSRWQSIRSFGTLPACQIIWTLRCHSGSMEHGVCRPPDFAEIDIPEQHDVSAVAAHLVATADDQLHRVIMSWTPTAFLSLCQSCRPARTGHYVRKRRHLGRSPLHSRLPKPAVRSGDTSAEPRLRFQHQLTAEASILISFRVASGVGARHSRPNASFNGPSQPS